MILFLRLLRIKQLNKSPSCKCISMNHVLWFSIYMVCKWKWEVVNLHDDAAKGVNLGSTGEINGTSCWSVINHLRRAHNAGRLQFGYTCTWLKGAWQWTQQTKVSAILRKGQGLGIVLHWDRHIYPHTHVYIFFFLALCSNITKDALLLPVRPIYLYIATLKGYLMVKIWF